MKIVINEITHYWKGNDVSNTVYLIIIPITSGEAAWFATFSSTHLEEWMGFIVDERWQNHSSQNKPKQGTSWLSMLW